jgi:hypothetical protein
MGFGGVGGHSGLGAIHQPLRLDEAASHPHCSVGRAKAMGNKRPFIVHIEETRHFNLEVWAETRNAAILEGQKIWREAPTTGQWELPDTETNYYAFPNGEQ